MKLRISDLFKIGIGPSSSHTVGPMVAARRFLLTCPRLHNVEKIRIDLYGSLALTGQGHGTDTAIILGLRGESPADIDPNSIASKLDAVRHNHRLHLLGEYPITFDPESDITWHKQQSLPGHPNGMQLTMQYRDGTQHQRVFYSTGGGFIYSEDELSALTAPLQLAAENALELPYSFCSMAELLQHGQRSGLSIADMLRANETSPHHLHPLTSQELDTHLDRIWHAMKSCIARGLQTSGELPGGLHVKRRAAALWRAAQDPQQALHPLPHDGMHKVSLYAMAVNEENAAGGRVVTAPTNGAAGIIPAVLRYFAEDCRPIDPEKGIRDFLLTAAAIGMLCKTNASISGAEIGCQGEVGVACGMAAAGLAAALGGSNVQIETAAEIGIEHHLGMTCDPIGGLVQIPCIERNGIAAVQAITAASLALNSDGNHHVSLDQVIETMRQTGADMQAKYKETSLGGLAVHVVSVNFAAC